MSFQNAFEWGSRNLPPIEFPTICPVTVLNNMIRLASNILKKEPNCVHIDGLGANSSVVVVRDVHGQLHDLIFLLRDASKKIRSCNCPWISQTTTTLKSTPSPSMWMQLGYFLRILDVEHILLLNTVTRQIEENSPGGRFWDPTRTHSEVT